MNKCGLNKFEKKNQTKRKLSPSWKNKEEERERTEDFDKKQKTNRRD